MNPKDPLLKASPNPERELFTRFSREANGFSHDQVIGAALNLLINALRQSNSTRDQAGRAYDELTARAKAVLMDHYDAAGRKRGIFPYNQVVDVPLVNLRKQ